MNKTELIDHIAQQADISKAAAGRALDAVIGGVKTTLKKGGSVTLVGFGTFAVGKRDGAYGAQSAHRRRDQDQGRESAEISPWQSAQRCAKLADSLGYSRPVETASSLAKRIRSCNQAQESQEQ